MKSANLLLFFALLLPVPTWAQGGGGGGVRGAESFPARVARVHHYIRAGLARDLRRYVESLNPATFPHGLASERRIFEKLFREDLLGEVRKPKVAFIPSPPGTCFGQFGDPVHASSELGDVGGKICLDPVQFALDCSGPECTPATMKKFVVAEVLHEKGHQHGLEEGDASRISAYVLESVMNGSPIPASVRASWARALPPPPLKDEDALRWRKIRESSSDIRRTCHEKFPCLLDEIDRKLPSGLTALIRSTCLWPIARSENWLERFPACHTYGIPNWFLKRGTFFDIQDCPEARVIQSPFDPALAPHCVDSSLMYLEHWARRPSTLEEQEKFEIGAIRAACLEFDDWRTEWGAPTIHLQKSSPAWDPAVSAPRASYAREICDARGAWALANPAQKGHLQKLRRPMALVAQACSLGEPDRLSGNDVFSLKWPGVSAHACYSNAMAAILNADPIRFSLDAFLRSQAKLLSGSCNFSSPDGLLVDREARARGLCLAEGQKQVPQTLEMMMLSKGCLVSPNVGWPGIEGCFRSGLDVVARSQRLEAPAQEFDRIRQLLAISFATRVGINAAEQARMTSASFQALMQSDWTQWVSSPSLELLLELGQQCASSGTDCYSRLVRR